MSKCEHLIDISPYDPLCDHPCRLYGGGAVEAECETCQYRIEGLERENADLRRENSMLNDIIRRAQTKAEAERDPCDGCPFRGPFPWVCETCEYRKEEE